MAAAKVLEDPESFGTSLFILCADEFEGYDFASWDPEALDMDIKHAWGIGKFPRINHDKLQALCTHVTTDGFFNRIELFFQVCKALNHVPVSFETFDTVTVAEMAWALAETHLLLTPDKNDKFNDEIRSYMKLELQQEGFSKAPRILRPYVGDLSIESDIDNGLQIEGIDSKAYWNSQQQKCLEVDGQLQTSLALLLQQLALLPLQHAQPGALNTLLARARTVWIKQTRQTRAEAASLSPR